MANILDIIEQRLSNIESILLDNQSSPQTNPTTCKQYVYGLSGLASLLNCSHPTAQRIKDSGKIPYQQVGRKIVFEVDAVLSALNKKR